MRPVEKGIEKGFSETVSDTHAILISRLLFCNLSVNESNGSDTIVTHVSDHDNSKTARTSLEGSRNG